MASVAHGGRVLAFAREHNIDYRDVLDFSANINPLGPSPKALEAIRQSAEAVRVYPDETPARTNMALETTAVRSGHLCIFNRRKLLFRSLRM